MALRVLLADESTTIKKVMQLALQDFAVEVKAVHVGVDVMEVARAFKPDIIFADVLLQKKNGYEVSAELKRDPGLSATPVVLMWSSFMDLDEKLADSSGADRRLEKPFDVENLRKLILELVPNTRSQRLATFLTFPEKVTEPLKTEQAEKRASVVAETPQPKAQAITPQPAQPMTQPIAQPSPQPIAQQKTVQPIVQPTAEEPPPSSRWNMESFEDISEFSLDEVKLESVPSLALADDDGDDDEAFQEISIGPKKSVGSELKKPAAPSPQFSASQDEDETWSHQDLSSYKIELPPMSVEDDDMAVRIDLTDASEISQVSFENPHQAFQLQADGTMPEPIAPEEAGDSPLAPVQMLEFSPSDEPAVFEIEPLQAGTAKPKTAPAHEPMASPRPKTSAYTQSEELLPSLESGKIPQLTPDRLEEIIRSQSREIIESVVRRIVPDLASDIIRQELQRLLEDTSVRENEAGR